MSTTASTIPVAALTAKAPDDLQPYRDVVLGLRSSGVHSNGFSLVRRIVERAGLAWNATAPFAQGMTVARALLTPTRIYVKPLLATLRRTAHIRAMAHITGGGLLENVPRVLPEGCHAKIDAGSWPLPRLMAFLQAQGNIEPEEMARTSEVFLAGTAAEVRSSKAQSPSNSAARMRESV